MTAQLHEQYIMYAKITSEMWTSQQVIKISDFYLAKLTDEYFISKNNPKQKHCVMRSQPLPSGIMHNIIYCMEIKTNTIEDWNKPFAARTDGYLARKKSCNEKKL